MGGLPVAKQQDRADLDVDAQVWKLHSSKVNTYSVQSDNAKKKMFFKSPSKIGDLVNGDAIFIVYTYVYICTYLQKIRFDFM